MLTKKEYKWHYYSFFYFKLNAKTAAVGIHYIQSLSMLHD